MVMELSNYAKMFKALSNEQRLKIFMMIYNQCCMPEGSIVDPENLFLEKPCCSVARTFQRAFSTVCDCMNLSRSTISHHFKELQNGGLINCEREGQSFRCSVNEEALTALRQFLADSAPNGQSK
jgi:ArsR family transcriptional regulator